jgi:sec-independent protein translocase protein TatC
MHTTAYEPSRQPFIEHIQELRQRLFWTILCLVIGACFGYMLRDAVFDFLIKPIGQPLYYTSPTGGFNFLLKSCIFFGVICATPTFIYHLLKFLEPALPKHIGNLITLYLVTSFILLLLGMAFAYFIGLPAALHFLNSFNTDQIKALISTDAYFSFIMVYLAGSGIIFQLPLVLLFINTISPLRPKTLLSKLPWVIALSFIAAAIITPTPDPINQTIMAVPIVLLYLIAIAFIAFANKGITYEKTPPQTKLHTIMDIRRRS